MSRRIVRFGAISILLLATAQAGAQTSVGTAFTYQGQLTKAGTPLNNTADFQFRLWDAATTPPGVQVGQTSYAYNRYVADGLFTVTLDFGPDGEDLFTGGARWVEIAVRSPAGGGAYTTLTPRQELTPAPYALALPGVWTQQNATSPNIIGGYGDNSVTGGVFGATIAGGGQESFLNRVTDHMGTVGGGWGNQAGSNDGNVMSAQGATVGGGANNLATGDITTISGGGDNQAVGYGATVGGGQLNDADGMYSAIGGGYANTADGEAAVVPGGRFNDASGTSSLAAGYQAKAYHDGAFVWADRTGLAFYSAANNEFAVRATGGARLTVDTNGAGLRILPATLSPNLIGGSDDNSLAVGIEGAVLAGGGNWIEPNRVTDDYCVVAGGLKNRAGNDVEPTTDAICAVIGGGLNNFARGANSTVAGGADNTAAAEGAAIGGGLWNYATGGAAVAGGNVNNATGSFAAIGGGQYNEASGEFSVVPGGSGNFAQGDYSFAAGTGAVAQHQGAFVWADSTGGSFYSGAADTFNVRATGGLIGQASNSAYGASFTNSGTGDGIRAYSNSNGGSNWAAVYAINTGTATGVFGYSSQGYAGYFSGNVSVTGTLSKGGGSFKIDHPLDPQNKYLYHSFVESPDMKNIYDGVVTLDARGRAWVQLPDWFQALNRDFRYQLTAIGGPGPNLHIATEISNNRFEIAGGTPGMKVSWQLTGIRQDAFANANRIPVEVDKPADERGTYLHPAAWGQPAELQVDRVLGAKAEVVRREAGEASQEERP